MKYLFSAFLLFLSSTAFLQTDFLIMTNGDIMAGEIKSLDKGILYIETPYSDEDFKVKWIEIKEVFSTTRFLITLQDGRRINGILNTNKEGKLIIREDGALTTEASMADLIHLIGLKSEFWIRVDASIDLGFSFTKANNLRQGTMAIGAGYLGDSWSTDLFFNLFRSVQDSIAPTR